MTWTASATVQDVSEGPAPIDVLLACNSDEMIEMNGVSYPALNSNTEGKILSVEVRLVLDEDETKLKVGDKVYLSGSFVGK